jgi:hypothetical protein
MQHVGVVLYGLYVCGRDQNLPPRGRKRKTAVHPGIQIPIHPNTKSAFEYQIRSEQAVVVQADPFHRQAVCRQHVSSQHCAIQRSRLLDFDIAKGANTPWSHFLSQLLII